MSKSLNSNVEANNNKNSYEYGTKEYIKEKLKDVNEVYVSFLNASYTKMMFWVIDKETNTLEKIYPSPSNNKKDMPTGFQKKAPSHLASYCYVQGAHDEHSALRNLYYWLGLTLQDMPRIQRLN